MKDKKDFIVFAFLCLFLLTLNACAFSSKSVKGPCYQRAKIKMVWEPCKNYYKKTDKKIETPLGHFCAQYCGKYKRNSCECKKDGWVLEVKNFSDPKFFNEARDSRKLLLNPGF